MSIVVQRYGGSSVANVSKMQRVAERVMRTRRGAASVAAAAIEPRAAATSSFRITRMVAHRLFLQSD